MNRKHNKPVTQCASVKCRSGFKTAGAHFAFALLLLVSLCGISPVHALSIQLYAAEETAQGVTIHQAVKQVKAQEKGKVLGAHTENEEGHSVHVIKIVTKNGRVKHIRVDAHTGAIERP